MRSRGRHWALRLALLVAGTAAGLLLCEGGVRLLGPTAASLEEAQAALFPDHPELPLLRERFQALREEWRRLYELDPEFGARPVLENGIYNRFGTLVNEYAPGKPSGVRRVLFLGDSATRRGRLVRALRDLHGDDGWEWWNAGVEGFSTAQEVRFYERFNRGIRPDEIILCFHNNDFSTTPVIFRDGTDRIVIFTPGRPAAHPHPWLLEHSHLYRTLMLWRIRGEDRDAIGREIRQQLLRLQALAAEDGARLSVVVLPALKPWTRWTAAERDSRRRILAILGEVGIRTFDLLEPLAEALRDGVEPGETPGDFGHPSSGVSARFARHLRAARLLE